MRKVYSKLDEVRTLLAEIEAATPIIDIHHVIEDLMNVYHWRDVKDCASKLSLPLEIYFLPEEGFAVEFPKSKLKPSDITIEAQCRLLIELADKLEGTVRTRSLGDTLTEFEAFRQDLKMHDSYNVYSQKYDETISKHFMSKEGWDINYHQRERNKRECEESIAEAEQVAKEYEKEKKRRSRIVKPNRAA